MAFLSTVLLARILGPEPYGVYALATTVLLFLALGVQLGLDGLTPRNLGIYVHDKDWPHAFCAVHGGSGAGLGATGAFPKAR